MYSLDVSAEFMPQSHAHDRISTRLALLLVGTVSLTLWTGIAALAAHLA